MELVSGRTANTYPAGCRGFVGKHTATEVPLSQRAREKTDEEDRGSFRTNPKWPLTHFRPVIYITFSRAAFDHQHWWKWPQCTSDWDSIRFTFACVKYQSREGKSEEVEATMMLLSLKPICLCYSAEQHERCAPSASVLLRLPPVQLLRRGMICPLSYYIQQNDFLLTALIKIAPGYCRELFNTRTRRWVRD